MRILALFVTTLMVHFLADSVKADGRFQVVREEIQKQLVERQVASLAVAVAKEGKILWEEGFGWADRERRVPATEHTPYSLASISKPITATALMVLVERGKVDLDQPANVYLGDAKLRSYVWDASGATVRRLSNHTAGLPLHYQFFYEDEGREPPSRDESIRRYGVLTAPPGERYQYANFGYGVLDYIIERTAGKSYEQFLREEVFLPLGMTRTSVGVLPELATETAMRYGPHQNRLPFYDFDHPGASAVFSSAHDLVRFGMFHLKQGLPDQKAILSDESLDAMTRDPVDTGTGARYGIGWAIQEDAYGYRTYGHTGGMGGVRTVLTLVPSEKLVVVVLTNGENDLHRVIERRILEEMLEGYGDSSRRSNNGNEGGSAAQSSAHGSNSPSDLDSSNETPIDGVWRGVVKTWAGDRALELKVQPSGDIHVRLADQLWTLLNEPQRTATSLAGVFAGDIRTDDANHRPYHLHLNLVRRGEVMNGSLTAKSLPNSRTGNALSYWVEVKRQEAN